MGFRDPPVFVGYAPTLHNAGRADVAVTVTYAKRMRITDNELVAVRLDVTGNSAGVGDIQIGLPSIPAASGLLIGEFAFFDASTNTFFAGGAFSALGGIAFAYGVRDNTAGAAGIGTQLAVGDWVMAHVGYEAA